MRHKPIPADHPVQPLADGDHAEDKATCGHCGLSWDDATPTSMTPAPSARCPFEEFHRSITLEICSNAEYLGQCLDLDNVQDGYEDEAGNYFGSELHRRLMAAGYETESAKGQRILYHGWNGANTFTHKLGPVGTFDDLAPEEESEIHDIIAAAKAEAESTYAPEPEEAEAE